VPEVNRTDARMAMLALIGEGKIRRDFRSLTLRYEHRETRLNLTARTAEQINVLKWAREENYEVVPTAKGRQVLAEYEKEQQR